ncbi:TM2 domain-containing protein [Halosimplex salinum]|uniref:TM2 domain-containing protein n=1 Tax=Halosimplex salinum TaxID=1710538 RepID=UPI000F46DF72|nr:NINE protein [Halosimplex salinum]
MSSDDSVTDGDQPGDPAPPGEKYCAECGSIINEKAEICPECGVRQPGMGSGGDERLVTALLAILLGSFGAHKFYLGENKVGVIYLCFFWTGIPGIIGIIEGVIYLSKSDEEFRRQYLED